MPKILMLEGYDPRLSEMGAAIAIIFNKEEAPKVTKSTPRRAYSMRPSNKVNLSEGTANLLESLRNLNGSFTVGAAYKVGRKVGLCRRGTGHRIALLERAGLLKALSDNGSRPGHVLAIA